MATSTLNRKATSHSYSSTSASNLDNNLDALLDDLQTSISYSRNETLPRQHTQNYQTSSRFVERSNSNSSRQSPMRSASPGLRSMSPSQARTRTIEKYVSTGAAGTPSGIPGLEMIDKELQDVQPGQSKTVAYKQVSYHYDKSEEGKNLESWVKNDKASRNDSSIVDDFCQRTFEQSNSSSRSATRDSPDFARNQNKEIIYKADVSTKTIPATTIPITTTTESRQTERDFKYLKETSYKTEPSPISSRKVIKTVRGGETEELRNVDNIPPNLAPGPNTKVTTTIKTYTYELPGAPENYIPPSTTTTNITKNVNVDKAISYTLPKTESTQSTSERQVRYQVEEQRSAYPPPPSNQSTTERVQRYQVEEQRSAYPPPPSNQSTTERVQRYQVEEQRSAYPPPQPAASERTSERAVRYHVEEQRNGYAPPPPTTQSTSERIARYQVEEQRSAYPPPPTTTQSTTERAMRYQVEEQRYPPAPVASQSTSEKTTRYQVEEQRGYLAPQTTTQSTSERSTRYQLEEQRSAGYVPATPPPVNRSAHHEEKMYMEQRRAYRQASPPPPSPSVTHSTMSRSEKYMQSRGVDYPDNGGISRSESRNERIIYQGGSERGASPAANHQSVKHYEEHYSTSGRNSKQQYYPAENSSHQNSSHFYKYNEEIIGTRPFPTSERPGSPRQQPPKRIEDLMASFSDSEEMHHKEVVEKRETFRSKNGQIKKEVEYIKHSPSSASSKNVAGPPVYYPPGSAEFSKKEESMSGTTQTQNGKGEWGKEKVVYDYGQSDKSKDKKKTKKAVVPVCLPLCCALPCSIM